MTIIPHADVRVPDGHRMLARAQDSHPAHCKEVCLRLQAAYLCSMPEVACRPLLMIKFQAVFFLRDAFVTAAVLPVLRQQLLTWACNGDCVCHALHGDVMQGCSQGNDSMSIIKRSGMVGRGLSMRLCGGGAGRGMRGAQCRWSTRMAHP